jgi:NTP pyrophosphatase (non-canonical NTP hydrolase)
MTTDELIIAVTDWAKKRHIDNPYRQLNKVTEELGEWAHEICRDNFTTPEAEDACGDVLVTVIVLADICGLDPAACHESAYHEISERKGHTSEGMFIKEGQDS